MIDISIVIVNWNAKQHLLNCLKSIYDNAGDDYTFEVIVVDNASTDDSVRVVQQQFPQVILIENEENMGFAKANNMGISRSVGGYLCLVNSDVILLDDCIGKLLKFVKEYPRTGLIGPKILNPDRTLQPQCRHFPTLWNNLCQAVGLNKLFTNSAFFSEPFMKYWAHDEVRSVDVITGCFWMTQRKAVDEVGLLDENFFIYGEDVDWCKRFHKSGWDVMFCPEAEVIHIGGASSSNAPTKFYLEMQRADLYYWRKHHGRLGYVGYWVLIFLRHGLRMFSELLRLVVPSQREKASYKLKRNLACLSWLVRERQEKQQ